MVGKRLLGLSPHPLQQVQCVFFIWFINEITFQVKAAMPSAEMMNFCSEFLSRLKKIDNIFVMCGFNQKACGGRLKLNRKAL